MKKEEAIDLVRAMHQVDGHCGRDTSRTLMRDYYFYGMDKIISSNSQCDECDRHKRFVAEEQTYTPIITTYPLERLQMDVTYPKELRTNGHQDAI